MITPQQDSEGPSLVLQWLRIPSNAGDAGLILRSGNKIPCSGATKTQELKLEDQMLQ